MEFVILKNKFENEKNIKETEEKINFFIRELNGIESQFAYSEKISTTKGKEVFEGVKKCVIKKEKDYLLIYEGEEKAIKIEFKILVIEERKEMVVLLAKEKNKSKKTKEITIEIKKLLEFYIKKDVVMIWKKESEMKYMKKSDLNKKTIEEKNKINLMMKFLKVKKEHYYDYELHGQQFTKEFEEEYQKIEKQINLLEKLGEGEFTIRTGEFLNIFKTRFVLKIDLDLILRNEFISFIYMCGNDEVMNLKIKNKIEFGKGLYFEDEDGEEIKSEKIEEYLERRVKKWKQKNLFDISIVHAFEEWKYQIERVLTNPNYTEEEIKKSYEDVLQYFDESPIKLFDFLKQKESFLIEMKIKNKKRNVLIKKMDEEWLNFYEMEGIKIEKTKEKNEVKKIINRILEDEML